MARDTLNLQGDEELEAALETAFDVRFTDSELLGMVTVGDIHDVIDVHLPSKMGACETSMTFYRLRRGLIELGMTGRIRPATPLPPAFFQRTNDQFQSLEKVTNLRLPPTEGGPLLAGCLLLGLVALTSFVIGLVFEIAPLGWVAAGSMITALILAKLDRGRLPRQLTIVGGLARRTSTINFGRLVAQGARVDSSLTWDALRDVISDVTDIEPTDIGRETLIYTPRKTVA